MHKTITQITLLLTLVAFGKNGIAADPPNNQGTLLRIQLENGSFEEGAQKPSKWTPITNHVGDQYLWDDSVTHTGRRSIAIRGTSYQHGIWESDPINVEKEGFNFYSLTGRIKTEANNGYVFIAIAWLDRAGNAINTADSLMRPEGDTDWHPVNIDALPPEGTVNVSIWCLSSHNSGIAWFDDLKLTVTQFKFPGKISYDQFLIEFPSHPLALAAYMMRVRELITKARWTREEGFGNPVAQRNASTIYAQAAAIPLNTAVLEQASRAAQKAPDKQRAQFETLIDTALWEAAVTAAAGNDTDKAKSFLQKIVLRNKSTDIVANAQQWLNKLDPNSQPQAGK